MKKRLLAMVLLLVMALSACSSPFNKMGGDDNKKEEGKETSKEEKNEVGEAGLNALLGYDAEKLLDVEEVPTELEYIVTEVSIVRYNKIGSEGVTSHSVEGETMSFSDNDFKGYLDDIEAWKNKKNEVKGVVKFL